MQELDHPAASSAAQQRIPATAYTRHVLYQTAALSSSGIMQQMHVSTACTLALHHTTDVAKVAESIVAKIYNRLEVLWNPNTCRQQ